MSSTRPAMIFVATRVPWPVTTGHYLRTFHIIRGLSADYDIHFLGFHEATTSDGGAAAARQALQAYCRSVTTRWVQAERSLWAALGVAVGALLTGRPLAVQKYRCVEFFAAIKALQRQSSIAVVHGDSLPSVEYLRGLSVPSLFTNHNVEWLRLARLADAERSLLKRFFLRWQARVTRRYEQRALQWLQDCVVVSADDRAASLELGGSARIHVVPNGTDTSVTVGSTQRELPDTALWVGGMNDPYNRLAVLHFMSDILPLIRSALPGFRWRVVGKDPPQEMQRLASQADSGIELVGFVDDLVAEYARSAVAVVPLTAGGGTKLKTLEALAMGRAVVSTTIGAEGLAAVNGEHLLIADSAADFAAAVVRLLRQPAERARIAAAGRKLAVDQYDWQAVHRLMRQAIDATIAGQAESAAACAA